MGASMQITVQLKTVYGETKVYPVCEKARAFAALAGTKTLTPEALAHIKALGFLVRRADSFALDARRLQIAA